MNREKLLIKSTLIISLGTLIPQLLNFITIPIVTDYLTKTEYGTYDLILTVVALLLPIATLQVQSGSFRFLIDARGDDEKSKTIVSNTLIFITAVSMVVLVVFYFCIPDTTPLYRLLICIFLFWDTIYNCLGQIARGLSDNKGYALGSMAVSVIKTILIVVFVMMRRSGLFGILIAFVVAYFLADVVLAVKIKLHKYLSFKALSFKELKKLLLYSWPLVPNNLSSWALRLSDRLVITHYLGVTANAVYAAANNIPNIVNLARSVFLMAWQENASEAIKDEDSEEYYSKMFRVTFALVSGITAVLIGITPVLFRILIRGDYSEAYYQMPILFMGTFFGCTSAFQSGIYIAHKRTMAGGLSTMVAAIINLVIDFALVNRVGIFAGSISTLVSYFLLFVYRIIDIRRFQKIKYNYLSVVLYIVILTFMSVICYENITWMNIINAVVGFAFAACINRDLIATMFKKFVLKRK